MKIGTKIIVLGNSGAGKSVLADTLGTKLSIPVYHLDRIFLDNEGVKYSHQKRKRIQKNILSKDQWIIEGHYHDTLEERILVCDTIILLDIPLWRCIYNVHKRLFKGIFKPQVGMLDAFRHLYNINFIYRWIPDYPRRRNNILQSIDSTRSKDKLMLLQGHYEVNNFVQSLSTK